MQVKEGQVTVKVEGDTYPDHTLFFISLMARILNKGLDNTAMQMNLLSIICTGKSFVELVGKELHGAEQLAEAVRTLSNGMMDVMVNNQQASLSDNGIDSFLNGSGGA